MIQDIFISTLPEPLAAWQKAFPDLILVHEVSEKGMPKQHQAIFWLHMNEDRQQWMQGAIKRIFAQYQHPLIVVLANLPNQAEALFALSLGAMGYAHGYSAENTLKEIKTVVSNGGLWMGNELLQKLIQVSTKLTHTHTDYVESLLSKLTAREREVAVEAAKGLSNKEIARILNITERTVKAHLASIFETLQAKDRLQLALMLNKHFSI